MGRICHSPRGGDAVRTAPGRSAGGVVMQYLTIIGGVFIAWLILVLLFAPHIPYHVEAPVDPRSDHFIHVLESTCNTTINRHNTIEILTNGTAFYPAMIDAIRGAREATNLEC